MTTSTVPPDGNPGGTVTAAFAANLPPPVHGQAVADLVLAEPGYDRLRLEVVPMRFASDVDDIGRLRPGKLLAAGRVIAGLLSARVRHGASVLVYSLGARSRLPVLRDGVILSVVRPWFSRTVLHLHTGDYGARVDAEDGLLGRFLRRAFSGAELILLDPALDGPGARLPEPDRVSYLNYGVADVAPPPAEHDDRRTDPPTVLFLGNLYESKGTHALVRAAARLRDDAVDVRIVLAGAVPDEATGAELEALVAELDLDDVVELVGPVHGDAKLCVLHEATVMCFPTRYEAEGLPLVVLEGMAAGLPVVSTEWRAIPAAVVDGETGFLVEPDDDGALADRLRRLLLDPELVDRFGSAARRRYEQRFSIPRFRAAFSAIVVGDASDPALAPMSTSTPVAGSHRKGS